MPASTGHSVAVPWKVWALNPEVECRTDHEELSESVAKVLQKLEELGYLPKQLAVEGA